MTFALSSIKSIDRGEHEPSERRRKRHEGDHKRRQEGRYVKGVINRRRKTNI